MVAITDKARMFDLMVGVGELVRDGKRDPKKVLEILQRIKENTGCLFRFPRVSIQGRGGNTPFVVPEIPQVVPGFRGYIHDSYNFSKMFSGKIEPPMSSFEFSELCYADLSGRSDGNSILAGLTKVGEKVETPVAQILALVESQGESYEGPLTAPIEPNIFFALDKKNVLREVRIHYCGSGIGWSVDAYEIGPRPKCDWHSPGTRVFFPAEK